MKRFAASLALLMTLAASVVHAAAPPETVAVLPSASRPVLALAPATGIPHVVYVSGGSLFHAWQTGGVWNKEDVADNVSFSNSSASYGGYDIAVTTDGRPVALYVSLGSLICSVWESGAWSTHTLDALPGPAYPVSVAVSPVTNEPVAAWIRKGTPSVVEYARRVAGVWSVADVDTTSASVLAVAFALDGSGNPRLAWTRPRTDGSTRPTLVCAIGTNADGPFVPETIETTFYAYVAIALDPSTGEPRLAYDAYDAGLNRVIRYGFHDGTWQSMLAWQSPEFPQGAPSLAMDAAGNPFIAQTEYTPVEPPPTPQGVTSCGGLQTGDVAVHTRTGGTGFGAFNIAVRLASPYQFDSGAGPRAIACSSAGIADVAWRSPSGNCAPLEIDYERTAQPVGIDPIPYVRIGPERVAPNPARLDEVLHVAFDLDRTSEVVLELHDVSGRVIAARGAEERPDGPTALEWAPAPPRAGLYWLTVRAAGRRIGSRAVVFVR